jgi:hypothetical protein
VFSVLLRNSRNRCDNLLPQAQISLFPHKSCTITMLRMNCKYIYNSVRNSPFGFSEPALCGPFTLGGMYRCCEQVTTYDAKHLMAVHGNFDKFQAENRKKGRGATPRTTPVIPAPLNTVSHGLKQPEAKHHNSLRLSIKP